VAAGEDFGRVLADVLPAVRAAGAAGRDEAEVWRSESTSFSPSTMNTVRALRLDVDELGEAVEHARDALEVPRPAARVIRPALAEALRHEPHDLVEQLAGSSWYG
jgi:hypothetical protein